MKLRHQRPDWRSKPAKKTIPAAPAFVLFSIGLNRTFGDLTKAFAGIGKSLNEQMFAISSSFSYSVMERIERQKRNHHFVEPRFLRDFPTLDPASGVIVYKSREVKPGVGVQFLTNQRNSSGVEQR